MSETLITWPDVCVFCGDSNGKVGRTANEHWKQFRCGTEYEVIEGKTAWIQDDECKIAELRTALAAATKRAESAEQENARLREVIRHIWVHTNGRKLGLSKLPADAMAAYQEIVKPLKNELRFISDEANLHKDRPDA
jgi:hypothetical protein